MCACIIIYLKKKYTQYVFEYTVEVSWRFPKNIAELNKLKDLTE